MLTAHWAGMFQLKKNIKILSRMNSRKEMKILKEEMDKLLIEVNYQKKAEFKDNDLNNFYNYWWCFEKKK